MVRSQILENLFIYKHRKEILKKLKPYIKPGLFYDITNLLNAGGVYSIGYGEKSNGKSTAVQMVGCIIFWLYQAEMVLLRTFDEDFKQGRAPGMFNGLPQGFISYLTNGTYDKVVYKNTKWYFAKYDENKEKDVLCSKPFCHRMHILNAGSSYQFPNVKLIFFDEFISRQGNYQGEYDDFMTVLSTIIRVQTDVQIFMMGNTLNSHSIYFKELGLKHISKQKQGTIDTYIYNENSIAVVEYCENAKAKVNNEIYFGFDNPNVQMITNGKWAIDLYPHLPYKYRPKDIAYIFFIVFEDVQYKCSIINTTKLIKRNVEICDNFDFLYIEEDKNDTDLSKPDYNTIVFTLESDPRPNFITSFLSPTYFIHRKILMYFKNQKVFYENNTVGDNIRAFINENK